MSKYSIIILDNDNGLKYHLSDFERMFNGGWNKFSCWFQFTPDQFHVSSVAITKFSKKEMTKLNKEANDEIKRKSNKAKKPKKSTRKS